MDAVLAFHQGFDGHLFIDGKGELHVPVDSSISYVSFGLMIYDVGNEYRAVVEFSPFQKIPKEHKPADSRQGTIESG
jgi:regulator of nonsense transcripts 3